MNRNWWNRNYYHDRFNQYVSIFTTVRWWCLHCRGFKPVRLNYAQYFCIVIEKWSRTSYELPPNVVYIQFCFDLCTWNWEFRCLPLFFFSLSLCLDALLKYTRVLFTLNWLLPRGLRVCGRFSVMTIVIEARHLISPTIGILEWA